MNKILFIRMTNLFLGLSISILGFAAVGKQKTDEIIKLSCNKPLGISDIYASHKKVYHYHKFELTFTIEGKWENPFNPEQIRIDGLFKAPNGKKFVVPGFFYQDYELFTINGIDSLKPWGNPVWKIRFTPYETGEYTYTIKVSNLGKEITTESDTFFCSPGTSNHGFVRVSKTNPLYFEYDDGTPFFAIANCIYWDKLRNFELGYTTIGDMETFYTEFARAGGNMTRNFVSRIAEYVDPPTPRPDKGFGKIDLDRSWRHDEAFELCEKIGICHQLSLANTSYFVKSRWPELVYNNRHGGPLTELTHLEYLTNPEIKNNFKNILRYFVARWSYSTAVFSWNLWNEADLIPGQYNQELMEWHREMAQYLNLVDWADHVVHTNFTNINGIPLIDSMPEMEIVSVNTYTSKDFSPVAETWIKSHISNYHKPVMFSEFGLGHHYGNEGYAPHDPKYIMAHNGMWSSLMSGSASTGMPIGWNYLKETHYFNYINALAEFTRNVPFNTRQWNPVVPKSFLYLNDDQSSRYFNKFVEGWHWNYVLPEGWKEHEIFEIDRNGIVKNHEYMNGFIGTPRGNKAVTLKVNYPENGEFKVFITEFSVNNISPGLPILTISVDDRIVSIEPFDREALPTRWIYKESKISIPKGEHLIKIENTGGGIFTTGYELTNYIHREGPDLEVRGLQSDDIILLWLKSPKLTWLYDKMNIHPEIQPAGKLILGNVSDGTWVAEWFNTMENKWIKYSVFNALQGDLTIETVPVKNSIAVKLTKVNPQDQMN